MCESVPRSVECYTLLCFVTLIDFLDFPIGYGLLSLNSVDTASKWTDKTL